MVQEDYFQRQIDQLGKALAQVLASLLNKEYQGSVSDRMEMIDQTLKDHLNIDMPVLSGMDESNFIDFLLKDLRISPISGTSSLNTTLIIVPNIRAANGLGTFLVIFGNR